MNRSAPTAHMREQYVQVGQRSIFVSEVGDGPPVLLLHGGGPGASGLSNYAQNIANLAKNFRVLVPDLPGYGRSSKGLDKTDPFGDLAKNILGLMDALDIEQSHVVGNSLGGACAIRMALDSPDRVGRLVLMGPGGIDTTRSLPTAGLKKLLDYYSGDGPTREKLADFLRNYLVFDSTTVSDAMVDERFQASIDPEVIAAPPLTRPKGLPVFRNIDFTRDPRLAAMQHPTLVLWGGEDKVNRPSGGKSLQKILPNCDLYLFANTGHWVQSERAHDFNAVTMAFLSADQRD